MTTDEEFADKELTKLENGDYLIPIDLPISVIATLAIAAHEKDVTLNEFMMTAINEYCKEIIDECHRQYNPNYGDDTLCVCGHQYYRHFDTYENMDLVGCKYCPCEEFYL